MLHAFFDVIFDCFYSLIHLRAHPTPNQITWEFDHPILAQKSHLSNFITSRRIKGIRHLPLSTSQM